MQNNPVSAVLASSGNSAILAAGSRITALGVGQLGIFSNLTGLSLDATSAISDAKEMFIAVGVDRDGDTVLDDVVKSAGQYIRLNEIEHVTYRCYSPSLPQIWDVTAFTAKCETEFCLKIGVRSQAGFQMAGYNTPIKSFHYVSKCCAEGCTDCAEGDANDVALGLMKAVNSDPEGLFSATLIDYTTTPGTPIVVAEAGYAAWVADAANADKALGIRITEIPSGITKWTQINNKYNYPRDIIMNVTLGCGFECNGTVEIFQDVIFEQGSGYDLAQEEYDTAGNTAIGNSHYRVSQTTQQAREVYEPIVVKTEKYAQYVISYHATNSSGGQLVNQSTHLQTTIAIPCASTTTRTSFIAAMDALLAGKFTAMANDNTACPACTEANVITTLNSTATDGIE